MAGAFPSQVAKTVQIKRRPIFVMHLLKASQAPTKCGRVIYDVHVLLPLELDQMTITCQVPSVQNSLFECNASHEEGNCWPPGILHCHCLEGCLSIY